MSDDHVTRDLFRAISGGWRNPGDLAAIALAHLFELCPHCRREFQAWRGELGEGAPAHGPEDYEAVLDRFRARAAPSPANSNDPPGALEAKAEAEEREARSRVEELLRLSPVDQAELVRREPERFSSLLLAEMLIEDSRKKAPDRPKEAATSARLARLVLHHAPIPGYASELYVRALAYLANAIRVIGDLPRADQVLGDARYLFRALGCGDRLLRAELDGLEGSLRITQDRYGTATSRLLRALMVYNLEGRARLAAATLVNLARSQSSAGHVRKALETVQQAEASLEVSPDQRLSRIICEQYVDLHCKNGNPARAADLVSQSEELFNLHGDPVSHLRQTWLRARISRRMGNLDDAAQKLVSVRSRFAAQGFVYDSARVALELAETYTEEDRKVEVEALAGELVPVFLSLELPTKVAEAEALQRWATG